MLIPKTDCHACHKCSVSCLGLLSVMEELRLILPNTRTLGVAEDHSQGCRTQWLEANGWRQIEKSRGEDKERKTHRRRTETYRTPAPNEAAYLSALSAMCKQRPFRAARHTIALFAMQ